LGGDAMAGARDAAAPRSRPDQRAVERAGRADEHGGRQEPLEALGDVEESADLIRYYCTQLESHDGFSFAMDTIAEHETTRRVLRPYGVWGVISPFNFPMALAAGPASGALAAGNTVVLKPSPQGSFSAAKLYECLRDAGLPAGVLHMVPGGDEVGQALVSNPDVDGLMFTGSYAVGMSIYRSFATSYPKPVVCEMGGKNLTILSRKADLDLAATGCADGRDGDLVLLGPPLIITEAETDELASLTAAAIKDVLG
jgi:1-pyrroline-5-carboxylate dehydrogenase